MKEKDLTDHDLLLELRTDMRWVKKQLANHLKHDFAVKMTLLTALLGLIAVMLLRG